MDPLHSRNGYSIDGLCMRWSSLLRACTYKVSNCRVCSYQAGGGCMSYDTRTRLAENAIRHCMSQYPTGINKIYAGYLRYLLKGSFGANGKCFIEVEAINSVEAEVVNALRISIL